MFNGRSLERNMTVWCGMGKAYGRYGEEKKRMQ